MHVMTTYRYFPESPVCWCRATENPKKLPLVFPSLITGNRSSILNPVHVCVQWYTAKTAQSKSPDDMFGLYIPLNCIGAVRRSTISVGSGDWAPTGRLHLTESFPLRASFLPRTQTSLPRCRCLPASASLCCPRLRTPLPLCPLHSLLKQVHRSRTPLVLAGWTPPPIPFFLFPFCLTRKLVPPAYN